MTKRERTIAGLIHAIRIASKTGRNADADRYRAALLRLNGGKHDRQTNRY